MPIRGGDSTNIIDVREGDGTSIAEVRKGDGSIVWSGGGGGSGLPQPVGSPIRWWPMDEGSGTTLADHVGTTDGTLNNGSWVSDTWVGNAAISGDGSSAYADLGSPEVTGDFAVAFTMVHPFTGDTVGSRQTPIAGPYDGSNTAWEFNFRPGGSNWGENVFQISSFDGTLYGCEVPMTSMPGSGVKARVVGQYTGSGWELWINNTLEGSSTDGSGAITATGQRYAMAFPSNGSIEHYFNGELDDVIIYDTSLTSQEITDDYNRQPWV